MKISNRISDFIKYDSIETRLSTIAIIFIMGIAITMGCMGIWLTHKFVKQRFHENFVVLSDYLASNAELGVLLKNSEMLEKLTTNMMQQEDIVKVIIKDADGGIIIKLDSSLKEKQNLKDSHDITDSAVKIESKILQLQPDNGDMEIYDVKADQEEIIGYVELYYTPSGLRALTKQMTIFFMAIALILSSVSVAWYWFFARSITSPLVNLVELSRRVSQGDLDVRASGGNLRETKTLAKVFNEMLNSVKAHQRANEKMHIEMAKQKTLAEIGKFSTMVAHELKNPISIIKGSIDIFKKKNLDEKTKETMIVYVDEEIQRLSRLVDEFLLFAKPKTPVLSKISMLSFLTETTEKLRFTVPDKNIKISLNVEDAYVECDVMLMERAILNILKNSVEHSIPVELDANSENEFNKINAQNNNAKDELQLSIYDAYIEINGRPQEPIGATYIIEIKDRGKGIEESIIEDIFNPFFTTRAKGTGLGLAIVKDIVRVHNGTVVVRNRPSGGAAFEIKIVAQSVPSFFLK
ncbi:MAG: HAMP domain-containing histidine kinase [Desulfamplus sp.]|nr:HAMP domain-containing histidine kinase [Desulfamplus sp.]